MIRYRVPVKPVLGLLLLGGLVWLLYHNIEFYEETEKSGWSVDALRNPYLAAEKFMRQSGIDVNAVDSPDRLDQLGRVGTLFFSDANRLQAPRQLRQVMAWLEAGGNVIYSANSTAHEEDLLLAEFEVEVDWSSFHAGSGDEDREPSLSETMREYNRQIDEGKSREEIANSLSQREISLTEVGFGDEIGELEIAFDNNRVLTQPYIEDPDLDADGHRPVSWSASDYGAHMMQFEVGDGLLTVISDPTIWTSYRIDSHDHAFLLWLLSSQAGEFAVMRSAVRDSIWSLARKNASELLIAAALLLFFWVWSAASRFGRILPREESRRRALGEHFSSVSNYLWHRRRGAYLVTPLRQQVLRRAGLELAGFSKADSARQYELLAERCGLNSNAIARAFDDNDFSEASFVKTVRLLKRIEQSL